MRGSLRSPWQLEGIKLPTATWETPWDYPFHANWGLIPLPWLQSTPELALATRMETWLPWGNTRGSLTSLWYLERNPKPPTATREKPRDSPVIARWGPSFPAGPKEQSRVPSQISIGGLTSFRPLKGLQEIPVLTGEESRVLCFNSSKDEAWLLRWTLNATRRSLSLERNMEFLDTSLDEA